MGRRKFNQGAPAPAAVPWFEPLKPVPPGRRVALGVLFFVLFVLLWAAATFGGLVKPLFLADPLRTVEAGYSLIVEFGFLADIGVTIWRVVGGRPFLVGAS